MGYNDDYRRRQDEARRQEEDRRQEEQRRRQEADGARRQQDEKKRQEAEWSHRKVDDQHHADQKRYDDKKHYDDKYYADKKYYDQKYYERRSWDEEEARKLSTQKEIAGLKRELNNLDDEQRRIENEINRSRSNSTARQHGDLNHLKGKKSGLFSRISRLLKG